MVADRMWLRLHGLRVRYSLREFRFLRSWDLRQASRNDPEPPRLVAPRHAEYALRELANTPDYFRERIIEKLYLLVTRRFELPSYAPGDLEAHLLSVVLQAVHQGSLVAVEVEQAVPPRVPRIEEEAPPPAPAKDEPTWFEVRVVWDDTGEPVRGVALVVDTGYGGGSTSMLQTDADGRIRVDPVPGACSVRNRADGLKHEECAGYAGTGERPPPANPPNERRESPKAVAIVERRRVRAGETLESVAAGVGLTWQKLAKFNFGTDDREKLRARLVRDVGCHKFDPKRRMPVFTFEDRPGVLLIPRPIELKLMATGVHHTIRIAPIEPLKPAPRFSM